MKKAPNHSVTKAKKGGIGRIILYIFLSFFVVGLIGAGVVYKYVMDVLAETPPIEVYDINVLLEENSIIYDANGNELEKVEDSGLRTIVPYEKIDQDLVKAIVAVEDKTFWTHKGFNYVRLVGAVLESLTSGKEPEGTSTITQQYARNMYLPETRFASGSEGYKRKVQEAYYAVQLEQNLSKEEILSGYLNTIEFGANAKGVQAATMRYFSKNSDEIDYIEAAILAGIPQANTAFSPFTIVRTQDVTASDYVLGQDSSEYTVCFNETCLERYPIVLRVMLDNGVITKEEYEYAKTYDIRQRLKPTPLTEQVVSSYFVDMVKEEIVQKFMDEKGMSQEEAKNVLYRGGLRIYSTLDTAMQAKIDQAFVGEPFNNFFDLKTQEALEKFQGKYSLPVTGIADMTTLEKMKELDLITPLEMPKRELAPDMEGEDVIVLKEALEMEGLLYKYNDYIPSMEAYRDDRRNILKITEDDYENPVSSSVMLNYYDGIIAPNGNLAISPSQYYIDSNGDTVFYADKMFNIYSVLNPGSEEREVELFIKDCYKCDEDRVSIVYGAGNFYQEKVAIPEMYIYKGSTVRLPKEYKRENEKGELVLSKQFFVDHPDFFTKTENGTLVVKPENYGVARQGVVQPQAAICFIDYRSGQLKSIAGGRNVKGQMIFNRATNPRQPGSSIKPLAVYTPALDNGFSPATIYEDTPRLTAGGQIWPRNAYNAFLGSITMRESVVQSVNVTAVKALEKVGIEKSIQYLKKFGITSLKEDGEVNDNNVAALALGGMSYGISDLEMAGAYGALANGGVRKDTITFTKILDKKGNVVLENIPKDTFVVSEQVAWLMQDMMLSAVMGGFTNNLPAIRPGNYGIPVTGKTGTTSNNYDIWFCGYTPYYASALWIGSDVNLELNATSLEACRYWGRVNEIVHEGLADKGFKTGEELGLIQVAVDGKSGLLPSSLSSRDPSGNGIISDWFIPGNQPVKQDDLRFEISTCSQSGKIATPYCPPQFLTSKVYRRRTEDVPDGARGIPVRDAGEIAPPGLTATTPSKDIDYAALAKNGRVTPYCYLHTGEIRTASTTADLLSGVATKAEGDKIIITESIIVTTVFNSEIAVDAGSIIYSSGSIVAVNGKTIYPWQIESVRKNPDGPIYVPTVDENTTETPNNSDTNTDNSGNNNNSDSGTTGGSVDENKPSNNSNSGDANTEGGETNTGSEGGTTGPDPNDSVDE